MRSKMEKKNRFAITLACLGGAFFAFGRIAPILYLVGIGLAVFAVILVFSVRCPYCGCRLIRGRWGGVPENCPNCEKAISDDETVE